MVPKVSWVTILDYNAFLARKWPYRVKAKLHIDKKRLRDSHFFTSLYLFFCGVSQKVTLQDSFVF